MQARQWLATAERHVRKKGEALTHTVALHIRRRIASSQHTSFPKRKRTTTLSFRSVVYQHKKPQRTAHRLVRVFFCSSTRDAQSIDPLRQHRVFGLLVPSTGIHRPFLQASGLYLMNDVQSKCHCKIRKVPRVAALLDLASQGQTRTRPPSENFKFTTSHVLRFLLHLQVQCHHLSASRALISFSANPKTPLKRSHAEVLPNAYQRAKISRRLSEQQRISSGLIRGSS